MEINLISKVKRIAIYMKKDNILMMQKETKLNRNLCNLSWKGKAVK